MAPKPLPTLPQELIDTILDLAMPAALVVNVNDYSDEDESLYRVHTTNITSLLTICARLRLCKYQRLRAIKALNTTTILFVDMISNATASAMDRTPSHPCTNPTYHISDAIIHEIQHIQIREVYSYRMFMAQNPRISQHLLSRRLTVSISKPQQSPSYAIDDFTWEYAAPHLTADAYQMLRVSRPREEARVRGSYARRLLPRDRWQISGQMLWMVQQMMEVRDMQIDAQGWIVFSECRKAARYWYEQVEEQGLVWELEG